MISIYGRFGGALLEGNDLSANNDGSLQTMPTTTALIIAAGNSSGREF
jgi:hypothetical protein